MTHHDEALLSFKRSKLLAIWSYIGILIPILGVILGGISLSNLNRLKPTEENEYYEIRNVRNIARWGIVLSIICTLLFGYIRYINSTYSYVYENNFKNACVSNGGSESGCGCALEYIENHYTYSQAKSFDDSMRLPENAISGIQNQCSLDS